MSNGYKSYIPCECGQVVFRIRHNNYGVTPFTDMTYKPRIKKACKNTFIFSCFNNSISPRFSFFNTFWLRAINASHRVILYKGT